MTFKTTDQNTMGEELKPVPMETLVRRLRGACAEWLSIDRLPSPPATAGMLRRSDEELRDAWRALADAYPQVASSTPESAVYPADWVLVPREPTAEMVDVAAMADVPWEWEDTSNGKVVVGPFALELSGPKKIDRAKEVAAALYRAMVAAATPAEARAVYPAGWVLVPIEPTDEMLDACAAKARGMTFTDYPRQQDATLYRAMLSAAPTPPKA